MTEGSFRLLVLVLSLAEAASATTSFAQQNCAEDMQKLARDRNVQLQVVDDFAKAAHGKPLDPAEFCAKSAGLIHAESALIAYMEKNKGRCSFPNDAINQLKEHHAKNVGFNAKACTVAAHTNGAPSRLNVLSNIVADGKGGIEYLPIIAVGKKMTYNLCVSLYQNLNHKPPGAYEEAYCHRAEGGK